MLADICQRDTPRDRGSEGKVGGYKVGHLPDIGKVSTVVLVQETPSLTALWTIRDILHIPVELAFVPPAMPHSKRPSDPVSNANDISHTIAIPVPDLKRPPRQARLQLLGGTPSRGLVIVRFFFSVLVQEDVDFAIFGNPEVVVDARAGHVSPVDTVT